MSESARTTLSTLESRLTAIARGELADRTISPGEARDILTVIGTARVALDALRDDDVRVSLNAMEALIALRDALPGSDLVDE